MLTLNLCGLLRNAIGSPELLRKAGSKHSVTERQPGYPSRETGGRVMSGKARRIPEISGYCCRNPLYLPQTWAIVLEQAVRICCYLHLNARTPLASIRSDHIPTQFSLLLPSIFFLTFSLPLKAMHGLQLLLPCNLVLHPRNIFKNYEMEIVQIF